MAKIGEFTARFVLKNDPGALLATHDVVGLCRRSRRINRRLVCLHERLPEQYNRHDWQNRHDPLSKRIAGGNQAAVPVPDSILAKISTNTARRCPRARTAAQAINYVVEHLFPEQEKDCANNTDC